MKEIIGKKLALLALPLCFLVASCGSDNDDDDDNAGPVLEQTPVPENEERNPPRAITFTKHCRKADEVEGGNFQYTWAVPNPGEIRRVSFNTSRNRLRAEIQGQTVRPQSNYTPVPAPEDQQGSFGELRSAPFTMAFPVVPTGTIEGSSRRYVIGNLSVGGASLGTYLCPLSILREVGGEPITAEE